MLFILWSGIALNSVICRIYSYVNQVQKCRFYKKINKFYTDLMKTHFLATFLYPRYEVYRGYIVFAFSVIMFVCLSVCLLPFFFRQRFLSNYLG